jgi:hypothetical protein
LSSRRRHGSGRDASERRQAELKLAQKVTAMTATPSPIWRLRADAKNENTAAETMITLQG